MIGSMTRTPPIDDAPRQSPAASPPAPQSHFVPRPWLLALVLVVVTFVAYQPAWHAGFIWDDDLLTANAVMSAHHGLTMIWTSLAVGRYYPLTLTTLWVQRHLWGLHPLPYHLVNILFHAANAVVVYFLLRQLRIPAAWLAAMVWALHPVNVQSVAWITEFKNIQSGFFFFLAVLLFLKFDEQRRQMLRWYSGYLSTLWYLLAFLCGSAAILSNASTAVLPLALLLAVWWQRGHAERADALRIAPYVAMAWLVAGLAILEQYSHALRAGAAEWRLEPAQRLVIAGKAVWFYAAGVLWPFRLAFMYPRWDVHALSWWSWVPLAALVAVTVALWRCRGRPWCRAVLFAGGYFVVMLAPVLGLFNIYYFRFSFVADRFQYLASAGIIALVCGGAAVLWQRAGLSAVAPARRLVRHSSSEGGSLGEGGLVRHSSSEGGRVVAVAAASVLAALGILTWRQARIYQDSETLWRDTLAKNPSCWVAHNSLGYLFLQEGKISEAIAHYDQALRIKPDSAETHGNLAYVFLQEGRISDAIAQYDQALRIQPDQYQVHYNLALALEQAGRIEDAIDHYQQALRINPEYAEAHSNLGTLFLQEGKISDAIAHYDQAVQIKPALPQLHYYLATTLVQAGRTDEAIAHFEQALRIKPEYAEAHSSLGYAFLQEGKTSDAIAQYDQALRIQPEYAEAHYGLALALEQADRTEEAFAHCEQALWLKPDLTPAQDAVARLRARLW